MKTGWDRKSLTTVRTEMRKQEGGPGNGHLLKATNKQTGSRTVWRGTVRVKARKSALRDCYLLLIRSVQRELALSYCTVVAMWSH
eukprot:1195037-Prorocentrum_minimum.AAC.4